VQASVAALREHARCLRAAGRTDLARRTYQGRIGRIQTRPSRSDVARRLVCALGERCAWGGWLAREYVAEETHEAGPTSALGTGTSALAH
jgi:hypothetical protein